MGKRVEILKIKDPGIYRLMKSFLTSYLPNIRQKCVHTIQAYKAQMSQDNVQRFMNGYEKKAKVMKSDLPHLHPHLWRRTRAMHLYLAGVPLPLVSEWLGHSNMETTRIYARATDEMKRQAQSILICS